jgi:hypothetical protein
LQNSLSLRIPQSGRLDLDGFRLLPDSSVLSIIRSLARLRLLRILKNLAFDLIPPAAWSGTEEVAREWGSPGHGGDGRTTARLHLPRPRRALRRRFIPSPSKPNPPRTILVLLSTSWLLLSLACNWGSALVWSHELRRGRRFVQAVETSQCVYSVFQMRLIQTEADRQWLPVSLVHLMSISPVPTDKNRVPGS